MGVDHPRGSRQSRLLAVFEISMLLVAAIPAVVAAQGGLETRVTADGVATSSTLDTMEYTVTFEETGLPAGSSWNVTINGTMTGSTSSSIVFQEPDGTYRFFVGQVPGYFTNPEGNVTVTGVTVALPILFTSTSPVGEKCTSYSWQGNTSIANLSYSFHGDCRGLFEIDLRNFSALSGYPFENSTFDVGAIAEVDSAGSLVALSEMNHESTGSISVVAPRDEVNVTDRIVANVTTVIGLNASTGSPNGQIPAWGPEDVPGNLGPTVWGSGGSVLGNISVVIVFHFVVGSHTSNRVKFDISISGWPWVNPSDSLGVEIGATADQHTYFVYAAPNDTIEQLWTSSQAVASSLVFNGSANSTGGTRNATLSVSDQAGLYPSGTAPNSAFALLSFRGPGGYSGLVYDPWLVFGPSVVRPVNPAAAAIAATLPVAAVVAIGVAVGGLGWVAYRARRRPPEEGLL
jgi:hypothetical protein